MQAFLNEGLRIGIKIAKVRANEQKKMLLLSHLRVRLRDFLSFTIITNITRAKTI